MGMGIASDHDRGPLGDPQIALTQGHPLALGQGDQLFDRPVHEPGVGRMGDRLGLHGGVHRHPLQILGLDGACLMGDRQALLQQRRQMLLRPGAGASGSGRAIEGELVAEGLLAAEVLIIGVLQPAPAQHLVR